jgi:hypothetical protein
VYEVLRTGCQSSPGCASEPALQTLTKVASTVHWLAQELERRGRGGYCVDNHSFAVQVGPCVGCRPQAPLVSQPPWMLHRLRGLRVGASQLALSGTSPAPDAAATVQDGSGSQFGFPSSNSPTEVLLRASAVASECCCICGPAGVHEGRYLRNSLELLGYPHRASGRVPQKVRRHFDVSDPTRLKEP